MEMLIWRKLEKIPPRVLSETLDAESNAKSDVELDAEIHDYADRVNQEYQQALVEWKAAYADLEASPSIPMTEYNLMMNDWSDVEKFRLRKEEAKEYASSLLTQPKESQIQLQNLNANYQPSPVLTDVIGRVDSLSLSLIQHLKSHHEDMQKLPPDVFEHLIGEFLAANGFEDVSLVGSNPSTSADIFAAYTIPPLEQKLRFFIEVKRTQQKVGIEVINNVLGAMAIERPKCGCQIALIVSLNGFKQMRNISYRQLSLMGVELRDRSYIDIWLKDYKPNGSGLWLSQ